MDIRIFNLGVPRHLRHYQGISRNFKNANNYPEKITSIDLGVPGPLVRWKQDFIFNYCIFPKKIMSFQAQWLLEKRKIRQGDIILQQVFFPPLGHGISMGFAVRISNLIDEPDKQGFTYETLNGHIESGISKFFFEEKGGRLFFTIHTFSKPAHWSSILVKNIFTIPYQSWCTDQALKNVRKIFHQINNI